MSKPESLKDVVIETLVKARFSDPKSFKELKEHIEPRMEGKDLKKEMDVYIKKYQKESKKQMKKMRKMYLEEMEKPIEEDTEPYIEDILVTRSEKTGNLKRKVGDEA